MLIRCPECNNEISDRANTCPHCGFPIQEDIEKVASNKKYDVIITKLQKDCDKIQIIANIRRFKGWGLAETKSIIENPPKTVFDGLDLDSAKSAQKLLLRFGAESEIKESSSVNPNQEENLFFENYDFSSIHCPRCGSTAVTTGQKGFSLFTGFLGSNKTVNRCGNCGLTWEPK